MFVVHMKIGIIIQLNIELDPIICNYFKADTAFFAASSRSTALKINLGQFRDFLKKILKKYVTF